LGPADGSTFRAGDAIAFSATATDLEDGTLPGSAYSWEIHFRHEGHIHPAGVFSNTQSGILNIPTSGHDFEGNTRYEIVLFVTDSTGLTTSTSVTVYPEKVDLSFDSVPSGLTIQVDGISRQTPFVVDSLIGFHYTIAAPDQVSGGAAYTFLGWSDGTAQSHELVVPSSDQTYVATFASVQVTLPGDYNSDQSVGAADYTLWRKMLSTSAILPNDTTPGSVTAADYNVWRAHYGDTTAQGQLQVVLPESSQVGEVADAALFRSSRGLPKESALGIVLSDSEEPNRRREQSLRHDELRDGVPPHVIMDTLLLTSLATPLESAHRETSGSATLIDALEQSRDAADSSLVTALDSVVAQVENTWKPRPVHAWSGRERGFSF
jgi:hypothetical protein